MFFFYLLIGFIIFIAATLLFQLNKKLIYQKAVEQLLAANKEGRQLQVRISQEPDPALRNKMLKLEKQVIQQGFKKLQPAHATAKSLLEIFGKS